MKPADSQNSSIIGLEPLRRFYERTMAARSGRGLERTEKDWLDDNIILSGLGLPIEVTSSFLMFQEPSFAEFEKWILDVNGGSIDPTLSERITCAVDREPYPPALAKTISEIDSIDDVLSADDLAFWEDNGYVIVRNAVPLSQAKAAEDAVWNFLKMSPNDPETWYKKPIGKGIMMEFYRHEALAANRNSAVIREAFAQLWRDPDLWVTTDRTSLNPPERPGYSFQGPQLHWDMSLAEPLYFGTQGILYLCDTHSDQGAFTCVPGFQREIAEWLGSFPDRSQARQFNLDHRAVPIAANAGDLIIWHQALPHGASPNRGNYPRIAQYINMFPTVRRENLNWM